MALVLRGCSLALGVHNLLGLILGSRDAKVQYSRNTAKTADTSRYSSWPNVASSAEVWEIFSDFLLLTWSCRGAQKQGRDDSPNRAKVARGVACSVERRSSLLAQYWSLALASALGLHFAFFAVTGFCPHDCKWRVLQVFVLHGRL